MENQTPQKIPITTVLDIQGDTDMSNKKVGKVLKSVRSNLGSRIFEAGAEKALLESPKEVAEFFTSQSYEFEITDPDDKN